MRKPELDAISDLLRGAKDSLNDPTDLVTDPFVLAEQSAVDEGQLPIQEDIFHLPILGECHGKFKTFIKLLSALTGLSGNLSSLPDLREVHVPRIYDAVVTIVSSFVDVPALKLHAAISTVELCLKASASNPRAKKKT